MAKKKTKKELMAIDHTMMKQYVHWCINKGYRIFPITKNNVMYQITIELGVKSATLSTEWKKADVHFAVYEAYKLVYEKHNSQNTVI